MTTRSGSRTVPAALLVVLAGVIVYLNSFSGAFVFDDEYTVLANPHIKRLWPPREAFRAPPESPVRDRPVVNLTLSLNHAAGDLETAGYHGFNLTVHLLAALCLFGILRRTFLNRRLPDRYRAAARSLSLSVAVLWVVHPLQTESVTYITQRCESLTGLFYLGVLYSVIRGAASPRGSIWYGLAVLFSALGMGSKASMVTVPLVVIVYDRIFLVASWRELFRKRGWLYAVLLATWLIQVFLLWKTPYEDIRGIETYGPGEYLLTQAEVIIHYLRLVFWPSPLCLDYGWPVVRGFGEVFPEVLLIGVLLVLTVWALKKNPPLGFLGVWFFLILAPTSSVLPLEDPAFEHRMYLPLAAVLVLAAVGGVEALNRLFPQRGERRTVWGVTLVSLVTIVLGSLTIDRNRDYFTPVTIWEETITVRPFNPRARMHLGNALLKEGRTEEAIESYRQALRLDPDYYTAHYNLGNVMAGRRKVEEAYAYFRRALEIKPEAVEAHNNLGVLLAQEGRTAEAIESFHTALRIDPDDTAAYFNLGVTYVRLGEGRKATEFFEKVIELKPDYAPAREALRSLCSPRGDRDNKEDRDYREKGRITKTE